MNLDVEKLIKVALEAQANAYAPYSNFKVGAALLASSGRIFTGCNVENAAYSLSCCAERVAVFKAISTGVHGFVAIAIVAGNSDKLVMPCGACRQVLAEFNPELTVIVANSSGDQRIEQLDMLLPKAFSKSNLI